jgi:hypothetical protein
MSRYLSASTRHRLVDHAAALESIANQCLKNAKRLREIRGKANLSLKNQGQVYSALHLLRSIGNTAEASACKYTAELFEIRIQE